MVTPSALAPSTYIKISDYATFAWNYTSLEVTPTAVDVVAYCSKIDHYYTLTSNATVEKTGSVIWDTKKDATGSAPLMNEMYTLMVYDPELGPTEIADAGHLGNTKQYVFGMYLKGKYTDLSGTLIHFAFVSYAVH